MNKDEGMEGEEDDIKGRCSLLITDNFNFVKNVHNWESHGIGHFGLLYIISF